MKLSMKFQCEILLILQEHLLYNDLTSHIAIRTIEFNVYVAYISGTKKSRTLYKRVRCNLVPCNTTHYAFLSRKLDISYITECTQEARSRMIREGNCSVLRSTFELERKRSILFLY